MTLMFRQFLRARIRERKLVKFALVAAIVGLVVVPAALALTYRNYWLNSDLGANTATSDGINHNHSFNELYVQASFATGIYELTPAGATHFSLNGNGWINLTHAPTYYDHPFCWNRSGSTQYIIQCDAAW